LASTNLSGFRRSARAAVRGAAEGALAGTLGVAGACALWSGPEEVRGIVLGAAVSWLASSLSTAALLATRGSPRAFWWAFGAGLALRLSALAGLMAYSLRAAGVSQAALLLAYAFGVLCLLPLEYRHIKG